jgi:hypothetical protein
VYDRKVAELWHVAKELLSAGQLKGLHPDMIKEMVARTYGTSNNKIWVEPKTDMKKRIGFSPDCFVAGTMILTPSGERSIEEINPGDEVVTPFGTRRVSFTHVTDTDEVYSVTFSNGRELSGKGAHKVFTWEQGWQTLDSLSIDRNVESATDVESWSILNSLFTRVENTDFKPLVDTIRTRTEGEMSLTDFYTGGFGLKLTGLFLKAITSITKTTNGGTTPWKILNPLRWLSTRASTCASALRTLLKRKNSCGTLIMSDHPQKHGTPLQRGWSGIENMPMLLTGRIDHRESAYVRVAELHFNPMPLSSSSAPQIAERSLGRPALQFANQRFAQYAGLLSLALNTAHR